MNIVLPFDLTKFSSGLPDKWHYLEVVFKQG